MRLTRVSLDMGFTKMIHQYVGRQGAGIRCRQFFRVQRHKGRLRRLVCHIHARDR